MNQSLAQFSAGQEIGIGNDDLLRRLPNGFAVGPLYQGAVTQVVPQHQGRPDAGHLGASTFQMHALPWRLLAQGEGYRLMQGLPGTRKIRLPQGFNGLQAPPELQGGFVHLLHQRPGHPHGKVQPGGR